MTEWSLWEKRRKWKYQHCIPIPRQAWQLARNCDKKIRIIKKKKDTRQSAFIKSEKESEWWKKQGRATHMSFYSSSDRPSLSLPACISKKEWRAGGMPNCSWVQSHVYQHPSTYSPPFFPHILLSVLPYPLSMPSCVLWIHLQIKQIYHSVMEAGKGGRLWNALALRAGKGSEHSATLPRTFPAVPALALSGSASLSVFMIHAIPQQPPLPIPVLPVPAKPTQAMGVPTEQPSTVITQCLA